MIGAVVTWLITLFGFNGLIGLTGLATLFTFVAVILQVLSNSDQAVQVGEPYGSEHCEALNSVINPSYPLVHDKFLVETF